MELNQTVETRDFMASTGHLWELNPNLFKSDDVKSVSSLSTNNKPIWRHNVSGEQCKFPATTSLYGTRSEGILVQRSLGY